MFIHTPTNYFNLSATYNVAALLITGARLLRSIVARLAET